jgi:hypothetical protein
MDGFESSATGGADMSEPILEHLRRCSLFERCDMNGETLARAADEIETLQSRLEQIRQDKGIGRRCAGITGAFGGKYVDNFGRNEGTCAVCYRVASDVQNCPLVVETSLRFSGEPK